MGEISGGAHDSIGLHLTGHHPRALNRRLMVPICANTRRLFLGDTLCRHTAENCLLTPGDDHAAPPTSPPLQNQ